MTLTDELTAAEQQRSSAVEAAFAAHYDCPDHQDGFGDRVECADGHEQEKRIALDRYAAVCRLAGRWEQIANAYVGFVAEVEARICAELARLMENCR